MGLIQKNTVPLLSDAVLLNERELDIAVMRIYSNTVFHIYFYSGGLVTMDFLREVTAFLEENGDKFYRNLYEFEPLVDLEPEVRAWASSPEGNKRTIADALLISSLPHKLMGNFYIRYNKPVKPTRIFSSRENALNWLLRQT